MPKLRNATPKYRKHRASGQAIVTLDGRDFYLGPHNSKVSKDEYDRLLAEWLANGRRLPGQQEQQALTLIEFAQAYWRFAKRYYRKNGRPTDELAGIKTALRHLKSLYGRKPVTDFGPLALKAVRQRMLDAGNSRGYINQQVRRIKRIFRWGVAEELLPGEMLHALSAVDGLRAGRTDAKELPPVPPVADAIVDATLPHLPTVVADMVRFQRFTGCRPGEVCMVRPCDVDTSGDVWQYRPSTHKTIHHGRERIIAIGPKAQDILRKYLLRPEDNYCFSARESERNRLHERSEARVTPLSCGNRPGTNRKPRPGRRPGRCYTAASYRRAIHRACEKAKVEPWNANRLRHAAATAVRKQFGLEAAQVTLGHSRADVTQVYAERDAALAADVARQVG